MQLLQESLQKFRTTWFWDHLVICPLQLRFIAWLYLFVHIFLFARSTQEYARLQFDLSPFGYVFFTQTIVKDIALEKN